MLFNLQKMALSLLVWGALVAVFPTYATAKNNIIYEYDIITQKKGQSFESAIQSARISDYQRKLLLKLPVLHKVDKQRQFRVAYAVENGKRLIREVKVTRGNRMANFVLIGKDGRHKFVSKPSQIAEEDLKAIPKLESSTAKSTGNEALFAQSVTQAKGQKLDTALRPLKLSKLQSQIIKSADFNKSAASKRTLTVYFAGSKSKRLLRGLRVVRGGQRVDYIIKKKGNSFKLTNVKLLAASERKLTYSAFNRAKSEQLKNIVLATTAKSNKNSVVKPRESLFYQQVSQGKGQSLKNALSPLSLNKLQLRIINSGDFSKKAISQRSLTVYFAGSLKKKLLRGLRVSRGGKQVDYVVVESGGSYQLKNLKTVSSSARKMALGEFASAKKQPVKTQTASIAKNKKSVVNSGQYRLIKLTQRKGKSLSSAMVGFSLSRAQRDLIRKIPVMQRAKSTRYFYLLFEKNGNNKYLKAVRVVRGKNASSFVLTKYQGKWTWANHKGQVKSSGRFLRYPVNFLRISSGFNLRRRHPITRRIRPHRGTDFVAAHGTPIWAPADGVVTFAGRQRGYGITLVIDHGNGYKTKYAHLSRIMRGARKGKRVRQKQIIAKMGNTGRSTGTHLHYEVLVNGRARNPMTVKLPGGGGTKTLKAAKQAAAKYLPQLRRMM